LSKTFIHIGYPRTATTTLQNHLFATSSNLLYLGKPFKDKSIENWVNELCFNTTLDYSHKEFHDWIQDYRNKKDFSIFLSNEGFLMPSAQDLKITCERLQKVFGSCHIILTLRNQWDIISGYYYLAGRKGRQLFVNGIPSLPSFPLSVNKWVEYSLMHKTDPLNFHHISLLAYLDFHKVIKFLKSAFGHENVSVFLFENFKAEKNLFSNQLKALLGCEFSAKDFEKKHDNKTIYNEFIVKSYLDRIYHKLSGGTYFFKQKPPSSDLFKSNLKKEFLLELEHYFCEANNRLQENIDYDLIKLGYPM
jgi:hypothetical protein